MIRVRDVLKTAAVAASMFVLTPAIHSLLGRVVSQEESITGDPHVPLLLMFVSGQAILMVALFHRLRASIPAVAPWQQGLLFGAFFLLSVQIPSVFGIVAFEQGHDWELFTPAKVANYATLFGDTLVFLVVGTLLGWLFGARRTARPRWPEGLGPATTMGLVVFPAALWGIVNLAFTVVPLDDPNAPVGRSLWFDLIFFGVFLLTGACLPLFHALVRRTGTPRGLRGVLQSTGLFGLLWLPVQNFMVVFGWEVGGALFFSALSMVPVFAVVWLADRLIPVR